MANISYKAGYNRIFQRGFGEGTVPERNPGHTNGLELETQTPERRISSIIENAKCSVREIWASQGSVFSLVSNSLGNAENVRTVKDFQRTFSLFQKSVLYATGLSKRGKTGIIISAYARDIGNPAFLEILTEARKAWASPKSLVIELSKEDYGLLDYPALSNIKELSRMGFWFAVHDFVEENGTVVTRHAHKLKGLSTLRFIRISESIVRGIKSRVLKITDAASRIMGELKSLGMRFLVSSDEEIFPRKPEISAECSGLLENARLATEDFVNIRGDSMWAEWLVRFGGGMSVPDWLGILKRGDATLGLLGKCVSDSIPDILSGRNRSVNVYVKDLWDPSFRDTVTASVSKIPAGSRGSLIFEILEERYGVLNNAAIANMSWLKSMGFRLAIDDLNVSAESYGMSIEILDAMIDENIGIGIVKIDGTHAEAIWDGNIKSKDLWRLRQLVSQGIPGNGVREHPVFIVEWIKNKAHAILVNEALLNGDSMEFWYQWRDLVPAEFR